MNNVEIYATNPKRTEAGAVMLLIALLAEAQQAAQLVKHLAGESPNARPTVDGCDTIKARLDLAQITARGLA